MLLYVVFEKISWSIDVCDYVTFNLNIYLFEKKFDQLETQLQFITNAYEQR